MAEATRNGDDQDRRVPTRLHDLLLGLAGRIDDESLTDAREFLALAEPDQAAELVVGALVAGDVALPAATRAELADLLVEVRSDAALADRVRELGDEGVGAHRFVQDNAPERGVGQAVAGLGRRLSAVSSLRCAWRVTPAGAAPMGTPQRVVVVESTDAAVAPATAFQVARALDAADLPATVEVLLPGRPVPEYQRAASDAGVLVDLNGHARPGPDGGREPERGAPPGPDRERPPAEREAGGTRTTTDEEPAPAEAHAGRRRRPDSEEAAPAGRKDDQGVAGEPPQPEAAPSAPRSPRRGPDTAPSGADQQVTEPVGEVVAEDRRPPRPPRGRRYPATTAPEATPELSDEDVPGEADTPERAAPRLAENVRVLRPARDGSGRTPSRGRGGRPGDEATDQEGSTAANERTPAPEQPARRPERASRPAPRPEDVGPVRPDTDPAPDHGQAQAATPVSSGQPRAAAGAPTADRAVPGPERPPGDEGKLNGRERDLLRQLHEELAERDHEGTATGQPSSEAARTPAPRRAVSAPSNVEQTGPISRLSASAGGHPTSGPQRPYTNGHPPFPPTA
ncbi:hypothetical protein C1701_09755 [Actinoalloteichus sp. AHMU CJ021]|uniref:hypothetical protein n=1 Tax=Actinoalloteichus sp. AHMU CJ021 TaxID=2072503 RepID=UPI000CA08638|nr:hypothetical protein C1701_09755 [Actinoalloteichus sp. AHMU CJ021]